MKCHIIWSCEFCHAKFDYAEECEEHEAIHYRLTYGQYQEWKRLRGIASSAGKVVGLCKSPRTEAMFDEAVRSLVNFEECHGLAGAKAPAN